MNPVPDPPVRLCEVGPTCLPPSLCPPGYLDSRERKGIDHSVVRMISGLGFPELAKPQATENGRSSHYESEITKQIFGRCNSHPKSVSGSFPQLQGKRQLDA